MVRTTIYLPMEIHNGLRHLAIERRRSMADLLRAAIEEVYLQDFRDLRIAQKAWKEYLRNPAAGVSARAYFARRSKRV